MPRILYGLEHSGKTKALLFVHGGLNSLSDATARVDRLTSVGDEPLTLRENYYPIFINWQASFTSSYKDHLFRIRQGLRQPGIARLTSPHIVVEDILSGAIRIAPDTIELLYNRRENVHEKPVCFRPPGPEYELKPASACGASEPEFDVRWGSDLRSAGAKFESVLKELPRTPIKPFATGLVIDSFGSQAWKIMIRRTEQMFHSELSPVEAGKQVDRRSLSYLLQQLKEKLPDTKVTQLDFIAHSAGAIILNRALREVPDLPVRNVVYMAAASSEEPGLMIVPNSCL